MTDLLAALGSIRLRDGNDATVIAEAIRALKTLDDLTKDNHSLRCVVEELQTALAVERLKGHG